MLLAAALISVAVAEPQAPVPAPPLAASSTTTASDSRPYTIQGVRAAAAGRPVIDYNVHDRDGQGSRVAITGCSAGSNWPSQVVSAWREGWSGGATPTWHEQFLAMVGPQGYGGPYHGSTNGERLLTVSSSVAIGLALAGITSLVDHAIASPIHRKMVKYKADRKQKKIDRIRAEIRAELDELERVNAAARAAGQTAVK
jgi:hypothetical protein